MEQMQDHGCRYKAGHIQQLHYKVLVVQEQTPDCQSLEVSINRA